MVRSRCSARLIDGWLIRSMLTARPLPGDVVITPGTLGGIPVLEIAIDGVTPHGSLLWFHGGVYGLPPLLIQAGSNELLLDDAVRLAARAAADEVSVTLDVTPGVPHLFQAFAAMLDEGDAALSRAAAFLRTVFGASSPAGHGQVMNNPQ